MRASALLLALPLVVARPLKDAESHSAWLQEFAGLESKFHGSAYSFATNVATMRAHNAANRSWTMGINKVGCGSSWFTVNDITIHLLPSSAWVTHQASNSATCVCQLRCCTILQLDVVPRAG